MSRRKKHNGPCSYCGAVEDLEREHVVPKCLFVKAPSDSVIIWSCGECNRQKSKVDEYLRDYLVMDIAGSNHPEAQQLLDGPIIRAVRSNRSKLAREYVKKATWAPVTSNEGLYLGNAYQAPIEGDFVIEAMKWIVRGLIFRVKQSRLPENYDIDVHRFMPHQVNDLRAIFDESRMNGPNTIGQIVRVWYRLASDEPFASIWLFEFYGGVYLTVSIDVQDQVRIAVEAQLT